MNLAVLDHIADGYQILAKADQIAAEGTSLALRKAEALRQAQAIKTRALMGEATSVRKIPCPYCACWSLLLHKGRARCVSRHCAAAGVQRSWGLVELAMAHPADPKGVRRTQRPPRDAVDLHTLVRFFKDTAHPVSVSTVNRIVRAYDLPRWRHPLKEQVAYLYSLSDVMTAHAVHVRKGNPSDCATGPDKPACSGLADLFFSERRAMPPAQVEAAKELCDGCPFREPCLDTALDFHSHLQHGVRGGMTSRERRDLQVRRRKA